MEIWRKILTKIYLLLRPEFLMMGKSKESKEGNSYYLDCFEKESQKGIGTLAYMLYMAPLMAGMLGLSCRPCGGPRQLKFGDY